MALAPLARFRGHRRHTGATETLRRFRHEVIWVTHNEAAKIALGSFRDVDIQDDVVIGSEELVPGGIQRHNLDPWIVHSQPSDLLFSLFVRVPCNRSRTMTTVSGSCFPQGLRVESSGLKSRRKNLSTSELPKTQFASSGF
jgi:hypothetical protein